MADWFQQAQNYHKMMQEITNDKYIQLRKIIIWATILITLSVGIAVNYFYGLLTIGTSPTQGHRALLLAIGSAAGAAGICMFVGEFLLVWTIGKCNEVNRFGTELQFPQRVENTLGSLLFYIKNGNFEKTLSWFGDIKLISVKALLSKVVFLQLQQSFGEEVIRIHVGNYADHSNVLKQLLTGISDACLTCIKSPRRWFKDLDDRHVQHEILPSFFDNVEYNVDQLYGISTTNKNKYPSHYVRFLEKSPDTATRRRAFFLGDVEWTELTDPTNSEFYRKFMEPCKVAKIETRFVNLKELETTYRTLPSQERIKVAKAIQNNITTQDFDIFEKKAIMLFRDTKEITDEESCLYGSGPYLEFSIRKNVAIYSDFLDEIFSGKLDSSFGVYKPEEIEAEYF